jgi:hypothetical protein
MAYEARPQCNATSKQNGKAGLLFAPSVLVGMRGASALRGPSARVLLTALASFCTVVSPATSAWAGGGQTTSPGTPTVSPLVGAAPDRSTYAAGTCSGQYTAQLGQYARTSNGLYAASNGQTHQSIANSIASTALGGAGTIIQDIGTGVGLTDVESAASAIQLGAIPYQIASITTQAVSLAYAYDSNNISVTYNNPTDNTGTLTASGANSVTISPGAYTSPDGATGGLASVSSSPAGIVGALSFSEAALAQTQAAQALTDQINTNNLPACATEFAGTISADAGLNSATGVSADNGAIWLGDTNGTTYSQGITLGGGALSGAGVGGAEATTGDPTAIAIGNNAIAAKAGSTALGLKAEAFGVNSTAVGANAEAIGASSVAVGDGALASRDGAVAVGLNSASTGVNAIAIGTGSTATGSVALGAFASAANGGAALGDGAIATGSAYSTAVGPVAFSIGKQSVAVGYASLASGDYGAAIGAGSTANGAMSVAIGDGATSSQTESIAVGHAASAAGLRAAAFGPNASATAVDSVALGSGSVADDPGTVSVGRSGAERRIVNLAPGVNATDAVNVWQLNRVEKRADAGTASVAAALNIPQAFEPGKGVIGLGLGARGGQTAFAFGASKMSANGRAIVKFSASWDSQGKTTAGGGVGFEF